MSTRSRWSRVTWRFTYLSNVCNQTNIGQALVFAASSANASLHKIYEYTSGIVFLGTLHNGSDASFGKALARCAAVESGLSLRRHNELNDLADGESTRALFSDLCSSFERLPIDYGIITLIGGKKTRYSSKHRWKNMRSALVSQWHYPSVVCLLM